MGSLPTAYTRLKKEYSQLDRAMCKYLDAEICKYAAKCGGETVLSRALQKSEKYVTMGRVRGNLRSLETIWLKCVKKFGAL